MRTLFTFTALAVMTIATSALSQSPPKLKPGAWEITTQSDGTDLKSLEAQLAKMPPEMREMMRKTMAAQLGKPTVSRQCIVGNEEALGQRLQQQVGADLKCETLNLKQAGATTTWSSRCSGTIVTGQPINSVSEHSMTMAGSDAFQQTMKMRSEGGPTGTMASGSTTTGRFLGADCKAHGALSIEEQMKQLERARPPKPALR
jgi:hypothetical protein